MNNTRTFVWEFRQVVQTTIDVPDGATPEEIETMLIEAHTAPRSRSEVVESYHDLTITDSWAESSPGRMEPQGNRYGVFTGESYDMDLLRP